MNSPSGNPPKKGRVVFGCFVILLIVTVLVGLSLPCFSCIHTAARKVMASNDERQIINAVRAYYAEYQKYPIAPSNGRGPVVFSTDNNLLLDALRNRTGAKSGNALNPRNVIYLDLPLAKNQDHPVAGLQVSSGIMFDPWGSPYHIAIDASGAGELNGKIPIPGFYSDVGPVKADVIVWSYGKNGGPGGGPATQSGFTDEPGAPGKFHGSGDVGSW